MKKFKHLTQPLKFPSTKRLVLCFLCESNKDHPHLQIQLKHNGKILVDLTNQEMLLLEDFLDKSYRYEHTPINS